jgi:hypothetical protein
VRARGSGSASIPILIILVVFSLLATGVLLLIQGFSQYTVRSRRGFDVRRELIEKADEIVGLLLAREPDAVDSPFDSVFLAIQNEEDFEILLEDVSSYIGLNWARKNVLEASGLLADPDSSAQELQQYREDTGLHLNLQENYSPFFRDLVNLEEYFTSYSYFNINICDEFVLRKLFEIRTGDKIGAELFHLKVHNHRIQTKEESFIRPEELYDFLGMDFDVLCPVVNAEPVINVNFAPESVLRAVLIASGIEQPEETVDSIVESRDTRPLNQEAMEFILGEDLEETPVGQYLGYKTWFWRLRIRRQGYELAWILARVPQAAVTEAIGTENNISYRLVEESYTL